MRFLLALALVLFAYNASAGPCGPTGDITRVLIQEYNEAPILRAIANNDSVIEVWRSADWSTASILLTTTKKVTCIMLVGRNLEWVQWKSLKSQRAED